MTLNKAIVVDVDGVLLDSYIILEEIFKLKLKGDEMWDYFQANCNSDRVTFLKDTAVLLNHLGEEISVILSTARNECCRDKTEKKLRDNGLKYHSLYMRKSGDLRSSPEIKRDHLTDIMKNFEVIAFIDDDLNNCEMAKEMGIVALRKV